MDQPAEVNLPANYAIAAAIVPLVVDLADVDGDDI